MKVSYSLTATLTLALTITSLTMSHAQLSTPVLMHYMPWFTLERENTHWSMQLREKDDLYLMERYQQTGRVAAHYTPLIGPYSSKDEDTIRLHLELLRQAGVGGVIINWYGISSRYDYPVLKEASDTIIRLANTTGMLWTLCYEDRTIDVNLSEEDKVAQLQADWEYIRDVYIEQYSGTLLRDTATKRPVFLQFGPVTLDQPSTWTNMLHTVFSNVSERPHLLGVDKGNPQNVLPDGGFNWIGWDLFRNPTADNIKTFHTSFYQRAQNASWYPIVGSTFPRFRDYYVQGNSPSASPQPWWNVTVPSFNGDTIDISIDAAREGGADVIQAVSWNDWQEGTNFEPSAEEGYTQLLRLQEHVLGREDEESMRNAVLAYNDVKASVWQQCDRVTPENKVDCGTTDTTEVSCEASGCCWRPSSQPGPWCFHKVSSPGVCKQPAPGIRNCTRTPEDRLCYCSTLMPSVVPSFKPSDDPSSSPSSEPLSVPTMPPTTNPTMPPTTNPTASQTTSPTTNPSTNPTSLTLSPTTSPTHLPSSILTQSPTTSPTQSPTISPTQSPTSSPTQSPTTSPTQLPTTSPTQSPTTSPTLSPTTSPTQSPTTSPTHSPSSILTQSPTTSPTQSPNICEDSALRMIHNNKNRTCKWAGRKSNRCKNKSIQSHCPKTCKKCRKKACIDSTKKFKLKNRKGKCAQVRTNIDMCSIEGVSSTCRETCKFCF